MTPNLNCEACLQLEPSSILTARQVANMLGISVRTFHRWRKSGRIIASGTGCGGSMCTFVDVVAYILDESASVAEFDSLLVTAQCNPRRVSYHATCHSPTESLGSRQVWARREVWLLRGVHEIAEPTHVATLQWRGGVGPGELRRFDRALSQAVRRYVERSGHEFSLYSVKELNDHNRVHCHVLIRSDVPADEIGEVLSWLVLRSSLRRAVVTDCQPIENLRAAERYVTKDLNAVRQGEKLVRLFEPGIGRLRTTVGYFPAGRTLESLREAGRSLWLREIQTSNGLTSHTKIAQ